MMLSVIIPVYNELDNIKAILTAVKKVDITKQIIVVDDFSTDGTRQYLENTQGIIKIFHEKNRGKGAAVRSALKVAEGDITLIQDADLEYSPEQYPRLLQYFREKKVKAVYGSRILGKGNFLLLSYYANRILTLLTNILYHTHITDMEICYKVVRTHLLKKLSLTSSRFDIDPEITCKILKQKEIIHEVPISYTGRKIGKKIGVKDGLQAVWSLVKWKFKS